MMLIPSNWFSGCPNYAESKMSHSALLKVNFLLLDKERLGRLVHQKNAAVVAITDIRKEDEAEF